MSQMRLIYSDVVQHKRERVADIVCDSSGKHLVGLFDVLVVAVDFGEAHWVASRRVRREPEGEV